MTCVIFRAITMITRHIGGFFAGCIMLMSNVLPSEAASDVVASWPFNGSPADVSGFGNDMVFFGSPSYVAGRHGQGVLLDGVASYGRLPGRNAIDIGANSGFTAELWIKPDSISSQQPLLEWSDGTEAVGLHLWLAVDSPGSLFANFINIGQTAHQVSSAPDLVPANIFSHVAMTYSSVSGIARLYVNGVMVALANIGSHRIETRDDLLLARRPVAYTQRAEYAFKGVMDDVTLHSRELSEAEIMARFTGGEELLEIFQQPEDITANVGRSARFVVWASGNGSLNYQWFRNSVPIPGATGRVLTISTVRPRDAAAYSVQVSDDFGSEVSEPAALDVRAGQHTFLGIPKGTRR
jgi:hypothetical protein